MWFIDQMKRLTSTLTLTVDVLQEKHVFVPHTNDNLETIMYMLYCQTPLMYADL